MGSDVAGSGSGRAVADRRVPRRPARAARRDRRRRGRDLHPGARRGRPRPLRHLPRRPSTAPSTRPATRAHPFTIQSMSKPLTYGLALELAAPRRCAAASASSRAATRSTRSASAPATGTPVNPMINAGAITCAGLVLDGGATTRSRLLLGRTRPTRAGRSSSTRPSTAPRRTTGHRNRAIAHLLRSFDVLVADPEAALDLYFRQCSVAVDCRDLALHRGDARERRRQPAHRRARRVARTWCAASSA